MTMRKLDRSYLWRLIALVAVLFAGFCYIEGRPNAVLPLLLLAIIFSIWSLIAAVDLNS